MQMIKIRVSRQRLYLWNSTSAIKEKSIRESLRFIHHSDLFKQTQKMLMLELTSFFGGVS